MIHFAMFAKFWEAGKVKTRLANSIGERKAKEVYYVFLTHLTNVFGLNLDKKTIVFSPREKQSAFRELGGESWGIEPQCDGDLGLRMSHFFKCSFDNHPNSKTVLIGSDTPHLRTATIDLVDELLNENDVVIGPSCDGGYYLIAMRNYFAELFEDIPWSTDQVFDLTIEKLESRKISFDLLPELNDIDDFDDLSALIEELGCSCLESDQLLLRRLKEVMGVTM